MIKLTYLSRATMARFIVLTAFCFTAVDLVRAQPAAPVAPAPAPATAPAASPSEPMKKTGRSADRFEQMHEQFLKRTKEGPIDILFLGDSITEGWNNKAKDLFAKTYGPNAANFGISGDKTEHVLWRITNGELDGIKPKVLVLMIGTNNTGNCDAPDIAAGVTKIVTTIREKLPDTKILLLAVFPRERTPEQNDKITEINKIIAKLDDGKTIRYLDIGDKFKDASGHIPKEIMQDGLHPTAKGYEIWAEAMGPLLKEMMQ
jgi:lysophospholipase L1-like esterase